MRTTPSRQEQASAPARGRVHLLMAITIVVHLIPISWDIGTLYMTPMRLLYMLTVPVLGIIWLRGGMGPRLIGDWLLFAYIAWMALTVGLHHPSQLITFTASTGLTILGGYLTARYTVRNAADFIALARFLAAIVICVLLPLGLFEAVGHTGTLVNQVLANISFIEVYGDVDYCCRLGLDRAQSVFVHPIHHGLACLLPFALYFMSTANHYSFFRRSVVAGLIALAAFTSVSSGAVLAVGFMGMLMLYAIVLYDNPNQWKMFMWGTAIVYAALELGTTKFAFFRLSEMLAFDSWNVFIRGLLYNVGMDQIKRTPIFGFGYNRLPGLPHWMTGSMDNYWLQQAVAHGVLGFILPFLTMLYAILRSGRNMFTKGSDLYNIRLGYGFAMTGLTLSLATVAIWAEVQSLIFLILGMGQFLFTTQETDALQTVKPVQRAPGPVYTRFPGTRPSGQTAMARSQVLSRAPVAAGRVALSSGVSDSKRRPNFIIGPSKMR